MGKNRLKPDSRRRVTLPKNMVKEDEEYIAIRTPHGILLRPASKENPLKSFQEEGKKLPKDKTIRQIREDAWKMAEEEALNDLRRH